MPTVSLGPTSLALGATLDNAISGSQYEFLPWPAKIEIGVNGSAAGLLLNAYAGGDIMGESIAVNAQNRMPIIPDDIIISEFVSAGTRLKLQLRNPTGGALNWFLTVKLTPL